MNAREAALERDREARERLATDPIAHLRFTAASDDARNGSKDSGVTRRHHQAAPPSDRQLEVLTLVADGLTNPEIAARLWLSEETIKSHLRQLLPKLGARDRTHAVAIAIRSGLID